MSYYIIFDLRETWRKGGKKPKLKTSIIKSLSINEKKHDIFENVKEMSGEEDEE